MGHLLSGVWLCPVRSVCLRVYLYAAQYPFVCYIIIRRGNRQVVLIITHNIRSLGRVLYFFPRRYYVEHVVCACLWRRRVRLSEPDFDNFVILPGVVFDPVGVFGRDGDGVVAVSV